MPHLGTPEIIIILLIVIILFGVGRISRLGSESGSAIVNFRKETKSSDSNKKTTGSRVPQIVCAAVDRYKVVI